MRLNDSEWTVMSAIWLAREATADGAVTAREIHDRIDEATGWAYTTLKTILTRLVEKGALSERKVGNQSVFVPLLSRDEARTSAVRSLVERAFDGTIGSLLMHMAGRERLGKRDRERLLALLKDADAKVDQPSVPSRAARKAGGRR
jgi:BlaI family transcriptional regulator, penicillinase repressor